MVLFCSSYHDFQKGVNSLPKAKNPGFQKNSWWNGCGYAAELNGNINTCQDLCAQGNKGYCRPNPYASCKGNSCSGGGCCAASMEICKTACSVYFSPP